MVLKAVMIDPIPKICFNLLSETRGDGPRGKIAQRAMKNAEFVRS
ncbi:hypothetical protein DSAG12_03854 [Promethearchaeum syntrophicum]|uniref:Uncharacterized protein n=1 Tax=Promethearchaeum syntrophicum TaxID=2594042 RepID=A0A5B9DH29_9ARCH|nr:hypothetical protein [Candidatus Prometheoarchaeum syntrophicum]QEE18016.1 hypothetical protein DSAG12_03854 [Candidatus Prometheoarchaeum syntrophicum]